MSRIVRFSLFLALLWLVTPEVSLAQVCRKGKPCGNTCIARNKTCRVGAGTARSAGDPVPATPATPGATSAAIPAGAAYVASSRGRVYYWIGCSAWRSLSPANLRYFSSRADAITAGYRPSASERCGGPDETTATPPEPDPETRPGVTTAAAADPCMVSKIIDGDTLDCADGRRIRLLLIDAPEMDQGPYGEVAKQALVSLARPGQVLSVETDVDLQDRYGRVLAHLFGPDGANVNEGLLRMGVAVVSIYPPNVNRVEAYRAAQKEAQEARRGLWALDAFRCLPSDHRAGKCQ